MHPIKNNTQSRIFKARSSIKYDESNVEQMQDSPCLIPEGA